MEALERFYKEYLIDYAQDSNWERYDADAQMMRNRVEDILETGYISENDLDFLRSILPDIENDGIREDLEDFLNRCEQQNMIADKNSTKFYENTSNK